MYTPFQNNLSDPNKYIYHYTSLTAAFDYILPSNLLRVSPFYHTNDPRESKYWNLSYKISGLKLHEIPNLASLIQIQDTRKK